MDITTINLASGTKQIIPTSVSLINPEREGKAKHLYFVWAVNPQKAASLEDAIKGDALGIWGFFSDVENFDTLGRHDALETTEKAWSEAVEEYKTLLAAVLNRLDSIDSPSGQYNFYWALCDCLGGEVSIGTSPVFKKMEVKQ